MLTSDLTISFRRGDRIYPRLIKTEDAGYLRDAETLIEIFDEFQNRTRGELETELEEYVGMGTDYRILRGLIKLLTDQSKFEISSIAEPSEIRRKVFLEAKKFQPILPNSEARQKVLETIAEEFLTAANTISNNLYADLFAQQKLIYFETLAPKDLLNRYNLAQAQALLYKCVEMKIQIAPSNAANYRAIFEAIKRFRLIHSIQGNAAEGYEIKLTGAASLFYQSQKYGIRMAVFLPALLLCRDWKMSAEISQKQSGNLFYELASSQTELISSYYDEPEYENPIYERLKKDWEKFSAARWKLEENSEVIDLGKTAFVPDFVLTAPDGEKVYLDVVGFWTPNSLQKRLEEFRAVSFQKFILAVWQELRGSRDEPLWENENVVFFKTKLEPRRLEETAENILQN